MDRSVPETGGVLTVVYTFPVLLLVVLGSHSVPDTVALLLSVPAAVGVIMMVTVAVPPFAIFPILQFTIVVPVHVPWLAVDETNVTPVGTVSVIVTLLTLLGPLFVTVTVYVRFCPTSTGSGESVFVMDRLADGLTVV
jgi:hypothetical protein